MSNNQRFDPFSPVSGKFDAPMGRRSDNLPECSRLHAKHQGGSDGYDRGGAYWGLPSNVWAVWGYSVGKRFVCYVRANSRQAAIYEAIK